MLPIQLKIAICYKHPFFILLDTHHLLRINFLHAQQQKFFPLWGAISCDNKKQILVAYKGMLKKLNLGLQK